MRKTKTSIKICSYRLETEAIVKGLTDSLSGGRLQKAFYQGGGLGEISGCWKRTEICLSLARLLKHVLS